MNKISLSLIGIVVFCGFSQSMPDMHFRCNPTILEEENLCIIDRDDGSLAGPYNLDLGNTRAGFRVIVDAEGNRKHIQGAPWKVCDTLAPSDEEITGNELRYVQAFEMVSTVRDFVMYAPQDLHLWNVVTKFITDCNIKQRTQTDQICECADVPPPPPQKCFSIDTRSTNDWCEANCFAGDGELHPACDPASGEFDQICQCPQQRELSEGSDNNRNYFDDCHSVDWSRATDEWCKTNCYDNTGKIHRGCDPKSADRIQYSVQDIKTLMENPNGNDIKNSVMRFVDEVGNELMCIMTDNGDWDRMRHCDKYRANHGIADGESSSCWEEYYGTVMPNFYKKTFHDSVNVGACHPQPWDNYFLP